MVTLGVLPEQRIKQIAKESKPTPIYGHPSLEAERQALDIRAGRQGAAAISAPETTSSTKLWAGSQLLHIFLGSWMVHICLECHSPRSAPQRRHTAHLGLSSCCTPGKLSGWDRGGEYDAQPTCESVLAKHLVTWAARTWEGYKMHSPAESAPLRSTWEPRSFDLGSTWNAGSTWDSALAEHPGAWTVWTQEVHPALGCAKPSVVQSLPTRASHIRLQCPSLPTTQLKKWP